MKLVAVCVFSSTNAFFVIIVAKSERALVVVGGGSPELVRAGLGGGFGERRGGGRGVRL